MIDSELITQRITKNYRGSEPSPAIRPRPLLLPKTRRLSKTPPTTLCEELAYCFDPYTAEYLLANQFEPIPAQLLFATLSAGSSTRSSALLGRIPGPARLAAFAMQVNTSGATTHRIGLYLSTTLIELESNSAATTYPPASPLLYSNSPSRGIMGFSHACNGPPALLPLNLLLSAPYQYLYVYYAQTYPAAIAAQVFAQILPVICEAPEIDWPDAPPPPPEPPPSWPVEYTQLAYGGLDFPPDHWHYRSPNWYWHRITSAPHLDLRVLPRRTTPTWPYPDPKPPFDGPPPDSRVTFMPDGSAVPGRYGGI